MIKYLIIHNKHEGCYDYRYYEDNESRLRVTSIRINPPKIFVFTNKEQAIDFFGDYINDVDITDSRCKKGEDIEHVEHCTCGVIETDDDENPVLFYNKRNQIFLLENGPQVLVPSQDLKDTISNYNYTNKLIRRCKTLGSLQRQKYIELGKICQECLNDSEESLQLEEEMLEQEKINKEKQRKEQVHKDLIEKELMEMALEKEKQEKKKREEQEARDKEKQPPKFIVRIKPSEDSDDGSSEVSPEQIKYLQQQFQQHFNFPIEFKMLGPNEVVHNVNSSNLIYDTSNRNKMNGDKQSSFKYSFTVPNVEKGVNITNNNNANNNNSNSNSKMNVSSNTNNTSNQKTELNIYEKFLKFHNLENNFEQKQEPQEQHQTNSNENIVLTETPKVSDSKESVIEDKDAKVKKPRKPRQKKEPKAKE